MHLLVLLAVRIVPFAALVSMTLTSSSSPPRHVLTPLNVTTLGANNVNYSTMPCTLELFGTKLSTVSQAFGTLSTMLTTPRDIDGLHRAKTKWDDYSRDSPLTTLRASMCWNRSTKTQFQPTNASPTLATPSTSDRRRLKPTAPASLAAATFWIMMAIQQHTLHLWKLLNCTGILCFLRAELSTPLAISPICI